ncbi:MAG: CDP-alcohol phosphatidyltransferase family protein [Candidatus Marinimicrobia bacterium]|nr:CDP-alcohol phosphatidyltransferase family protein [Candidatus Neomarinimicrobiota bacterium]
MYEDQIKDKFVTQESDTTRYFTAANIISMARIVLTIPAVWLFATDRWVWGLIILGICVVSDWLDGFVARKTHEVSDFGKFIDPVADKVVAAGMIVLMIIRMDFPLWFLLVLTVRDASIYTMKRIFYKRSGIVTGANIAGKMFLLVMTVAGVLWLLEFYLGINLFAIYVLWLSTLLMLISWVVYTIQSVKLFRSQETEDGSRKSK